MTRTIADSERALLKWLIREEAQCRFCGIERDDPRASSACQSVYNRNAFHDFGGK